MNIYDIAREAGVSIATVSRVLNQSSSVSEKTRKKVEEVLARSNYTPSAIARGMVTQSMRTVAVLTVDIRVPHYAATAYTIEQAFSHRGYEVILCNTGGERDAALKYLQAVIKKQVDGIILVGSVFNTIGRDPQIETLLRTVPVVLANGQLDLPNAYSVLVDDSRGVELTVEHLTAQGRSHLWYIRDLETDSAYEKEAGFHRSLTERGIDADNYIVETEHTMEGAVKALDAILTATAPCDGIICGEDLIAAAVVNELARRGIAVPEQIAVTGFDNSMYARLCRPELTTVDNKPEAVAMECVQLLERLMAGREGCSHVRIQPELLMGGSA